MTLLSIEMLSVSYRRVPALVSVNLSIEEGELVGLIGPNGAGKTTTLKSIFGLVKILSGDITYEGKSIKGRVPEDIARLGLALVPEGRHIFQSLTVSENLLMGYANGRGKGRGKDLEESVLDRFPILRKYYRKPAAGLSGGEQQQLAIGRALLSNPRLLILDEPSLGLAPLMVDEVFNALAALRSGGTTILLVEQNATRTVALADRTYVLSSGQIVAHGTSHELSADQNIRRAYLGQAAL